MMTETEMGGQADRVTFYDRTVAFLASAFVGGVAWAGLLGLIALLRFGAEYFEIPWPDNYYLELVLLNLPWLFGVFAGWINYGKVLEMEG